MQAERYRSVAADTNGVLASPRADLLLGQGLDLVAVLVLQPCRGAGKETETETETETEIDRQMETDTEGDRDTIHINTER